MGDHEHDLDTSGNLDNPSSDSLLANDNANENNIPYIIGGAACFVVCICFVCVFWNKRRKRQQENNFKVNTTFVQQSGESNAVSGTAESVLSLSPKSMASI